MIIVKLIGGLGNQMFQYAYGLQLAKAYGEDICFDVSYYPPEKPLALYNLNVPAYPLWDAVGIAEKERKSVVRAQKIFHVHQKLIRILGKTDRTGHKLFIKHAKKGRLFNFDPYYYEIPTTEKKNKYLYGYFQGEQYFDTCKEQLKREFTVSKTLSETAHVYLQQIRASKAVARHIRLGDYKNAKNTDLDVCSLAYYKRALAYIRDHLEGYRMFVFTNDAQQASGMLEFPEGTVMVQGTRDYEDFALMQQCSHFVLSNSTFSWWAAYLAENPDKIITVPEKWRHSEKDEPAIYTANMVKLPIGE